MQCAPLSARLWMSAGAQGEAEAEEGAKGESKELQQPAGER